MYGPDHCVPVRVARDDNPETIAQIVQTLRAPELGWPFIQLVVEPGAGSVGPMFAALDALGNGFSVGALVDPVTAVDLAASNALQVLTVALDGRDPLEDLRALATVVRQEGRVLEAVTTADIDEAELERIGFFRVVVRGSDSDPYQLAADAHVDGRGFVHVDGRRSEVPIHEGGLDAALASVGCDFSVFRLPAPLVLPFAYRVPEPEGVSGEVVYSMAGTQAFAVRLEEDECRAALGFRSAEWAEFEAFLGDDSSEHVLFPPFVWSGPGLAPDEEGNLPPRKAQSERCRFAAWLARGLVDEVGYSLGLVHELDYQPAKPNLAHSDNLKPMLQRIDLRLCASLELLARSRAPRARRLLALKALNKVATDEAKRTLHRLAQDGVEGAEQHERLWSTTHAQPRRKKRGNKEPLARLQHFQEALAVMKLANQEGGQ